MGSLLQTKLAYIDHIIDQILPGLRQQAPVIVLVRRDAVFSVADFDDDLDCAELDAAVPPRTVRPAGPHVLGHPHRRQYGGRDRHRYLGARRGHLRLVEAGRAEVSVVAD